MNHNTLESYMNTNKLQLEEFRNALISSIASFVYSEYLINMEEKTTPIKKILVPQIKSVKEFLNKDSQFMKLISNNLVDNIINDNLLQKYIKEFMLFNDPENLKMFINSYLMEDIWYMIPSTICKKFNLSNTSNGMFIESRELDLFGRMPIDDEQFKYIIDQTILQLLMSSPSITKASYDLVNNRNIYLKKNEILSIKNDNAICELYLNTPIIENASIIKLIQFVTSGSISHLMDDNQPYEYIITVGNSNEVSIINIKD